jgi:SAM-dependent methyltransferase
MSERKAITGEALEQEQLSVQTGANGKCRVRSLDEYSRYLCWNRIIQETKDGLHTARLCQTFDVKPIKSTLPSLFGGGPRPVKLVPEKTNWMVKIITQLEKQNPAQPLKWVDVGCGHRIAQREFQLAYPNSRMETVGIDLIPPSWQEVDVQIPTLEKAETRKHYRRLAQVPDNTIKGDATQLKFGPCHLITAVEVIQYIEDKLAALCHWYNQLAPGGILIVTTETDWASWIRLKDERFGANQVMDQFLSQVKYITEHMRRDDSDDIRTLIVFKEEGKTLKPKSKPTKIWINPHGYKASYYRGKDCHVQAVVKAQFQPIDSVKLNETVDESLNS